MPWYWLFYGSLIFPYRLLINRCTNGNFCNLEFLIPESCRTALTCLTEPIFLCSKRFLISNVIYKKKRQSFKIYLKELPLAYYSASKYATKKTWGNGVIQEEIWTCWLFAYGITGNHLTLLYIQDSLTTLKRVNLISFDSLGHAYLLHHTSRMPTLLYYCADASPSLLSSPSFPSLLSSPNSFSSILPQPPFLSLSHFLFFSFVLHNDTYIL